MRSSLFRIGENMKIRKNTRRLRREAKNRFYIRFRSYGHVRLIWSIENVVYIRKLLSENNLDFRMIAPLRNRCISFIHQRFQLVAYSSLRV